MGSKNKLKYEGKLYSTKNYGDLHILEYVSYHDVLVKFSKTGYTTKARLDHILNGQVKDKSIPTVHGVGIAWCEEENFDFEKTREYTVWTSLLQRCYSAKLHEKRQTYQNCTTSESFKYYHKFLKWSEDQIGFYSIDDKGRRFALDKDILVKGNKIYSEDTCCFVPQEINSLFIKNDASRGELPIGVTSNGATTKYIATIRLTTRNKHLGSFTTPEEAFYAYKEAKEQRIKELANKWKDQIDPRVYEALMNYQVEITD